jgi:carboxyl-terminal processing protease
MPQAYRGLRPVKTVEISAIITTYDKEGSLDRVPRFDAAGRARHGWRLMGAPRAAAQANNPHLRVFEDVIRLVLNAYVEDVDVDKVMDGAMHGLTDGLDTSSAFLQPDEVKAIESKAAMPDGDIGLVVTRQFYLRVLGVREGSPAARAGLQVTDYVRMIDGRPTRDMSGVTGMRLLRGQPGSKVSIVIIRSGNTSDPHTIELVREKLQGEVVRSSTVDGVARVRVSSFGPDTSAALQSAFEKIVASKTPGAVIDLRGTADGTPEDGIKAARLFVKSGTIGVRAARTGDPVKTTAAAGDGAVTLPVVLLVSNGTSNAAEAFAAALSGNGRADLSANRRLASRPGKSSSRCPMVTACGSPTSGT